ncbi:MAG: MFS transporter, partial [bacterium]
MASKLQGFFDKLPPTLIKKNNVSIFPEGAIGYLVGPTLALLCNSILANYFNKYMSDVLHINDWASAFFTALPVVSVIFVVIGNILVGRLMDSSRSKNGKARPLLLLSVPVSLLALLFLFVFSPFNANNDSWHVGALVCIAIGYNLWFAFAYPLYYTPHAALVNLSTRNSGDRSLLATISNATALAAMGLSSMILPFFLNLLFVYQTTNLPEGAVAMNGGEYYTLDGVTLYDQQASYAHWKAFVIALI